MFQLAGCAEGWSARRGQKGDLGDRLGRAFITKLSRLDFILEARRAIGRFLRRRGMIYQKKPERANDEAEEVVQGRPLA